MKKTQRQKERHGVERERDREREEGGKNDREKGGENRKAKHNLSSKCCQSDKKAEKRALYHPHVKTTCLIKSVHSF